jgi:ubiquinol-cytochrome c reductase cytochrome b subunit
MFGGEFPGEAFIPRLYTIHVLLLPGIFLALITVHLILVVVHKHTHYPGPGRTNKNVVGYPLFPIYVAKAGGFFFIVFGVITLLSAFITINPIWAYGTYDPSPVSSGAQPDWYMGWLDGAVRLTPGFLEFTLWGFTVSLNILLPALIIPGLMTMPMILYPWIEQWATGDKREHHLLDRPRNAPVRTGLGAMAITWYVLLWISGGNDIIAFMLRLSINDLTNILRVLLFALPPIVFFITKRVCLGLQRKDRELVLHGVETGRVFRTEDGEVFELHEPLGEHDRWLLVQHDSYAPVALDPAEDEHGVRRRGGLLDGARRKLSSFYFEDRIEPVTPAELAAAHDGHHDHGDHEAIEDAHDEDRTPAITAGN